MTVSVTKTDLSRYETFRVIGPNSNHLTIAVRGQAHPNTDISRGRYSIHLMLWGDFGPWENFWSHAGGADETWWNWLYDTDRDYWLNKVVGSYREFDFEKSQRYVLDEIIRLRREGVLDKDDTRNSYNTISQMDEVSRDLFIAKIGELSYTPQGKFREYIMFEEYWELAYERTKPKLIWFWDNIWRPFIEQAKATEGFTKTLVAA